MRSTSSASESCWRPLASGWTVASALIRGRGMEVADARTPAGPGRLMLAHDRRHEPIETTRGPHSPMASTRNPRLGAVLGTSIACASCAFEADLLTTRDAGDTFDAAADAAAASSLGFDAGSWRYEGGVTLSDSGM